MFGINPQFLKFLNLLAAKKDGESLAYWQESIDFLTVFIGDGDCREYCLMGFFSPYVDITHKLYSQEGVDPFVGFHMSGGIQTFLRLHYKKLLGEEGYALFKAKHNADCHLYHASELLDMWLEEFPATKLEQLARVRKALELQNPTVHIPL
ncbi:MAG: hypothetical protein Q8L52_03270 [bacterium]|nr:hypothetical protein [bacterium]